MNIRQAEKKDIEGILRLLSQVLEVHAAIRPDLFISGRTKYTAEELEGIIANDSTPVYVAAEADKVAGYAFCILKAEPATNCTYPRKEIYIDDICVDVNMRHGGIAESLFRHVEAVARELQVDGITLNVWEGNEPAEKFYEKMGMKARKTMMEYEIR